MEHHFHELFEKKDTFLDLEGASKKLSKEIKNELTPRQFKAFQMLFIENKTEEQVAKYLGFKTTEKRDPQATNK